MGISGVGFRARAQDLEGGGGGGLQVEGLRAFADIDLWGVEDGLGVISGLWDVKENCTVRVGPSSIPTIPKGLNK